MWRAAGTIEKAAQAHLFDLKLAGAKFLGGSHDGVILRAIEAL